MSVPWFSTAQSWASSASANGPPSLQRGRDAKVRFFAHACDWLQLLPTYRIARQSG
jgi:hypothetical protein